MTSRCRGFAPSSNKYVPVYTPKACPDPVNNDPKRTEVYCKPNPCRSEPLSHSEYLRKLTQNNGRAISGGTLKQYGDGVYKRTDWMATEGSCILGNVPVPVAQSIKQEGKPANIQFPKAVDASLQTIRKDLIASRGSIGTYDNVNRGAEMTIKRHGGLAVLSSTGCSTCDISGTGIKLPECTNCN